MFVLFLSWFRIYFVLRLFTFKKYDGRKSSRIDLVCQWFILNGISKTFCFGFIRSFFFSLLLLFSVTYIRFILLLSVFIIGEMVKRDALALAVDPLQFNAQCENVSGIRWHMYYRLTWAHVFTKIPIYTFLWFISPFFLLFSSHFGANALSCTIFIFASFGLLLFLLLNTFIYFSITLCTFFILDLIFFFFRCSSVCVAFYFMNWFSEFSRTTSSSSSLSKG